MGAGRQACGFRPFWRFLRGDSLVIADADGQNPREIVTREGGRHLHWPRWSADGRFLYFNYRFATFNAERTEIYRVPRQEALPKASSLRHDERRYPLPSPDGRGSFFAANPDGVDTNLWWLDLGTGRRSTI